MWKNLSLLFVAGLLLSACGTPPAAPLSSSAPEVAFSPPPPAPRQPTAAATPVLGFRPAPPQIVFVPMPTGAILLQEDNKNINHQFCVSFFQETKSATELMDEENNVVQLFWLTTSARKDFSPPKEGTALSAWCDWAIGPDVYDYRRAAALFAAIGRSNSKGPVLLAMANSDLHRDNMIIDAEKLPADQIPLLAQTWRSAFMKLSSAALTAEKAALLPAPDRNPATVKPHGGKSAKNVCAPKVGVMTEGGYTITTSMVPLDCAVHNEKNSGIHPDHPAPKAGDRTDPIDARLDPDEHPTTHLMCTALDGMLPAAAIIPELFLAGEVFDYAYCKGVMRDIYKLLHKPHKE